MLWWWNWDINFMDLFYTIYSTRRLIETSVKHLYNRVEITKRDFFCLHNVFTIETKVLSEALQSSRILQCDIYVQQYRWKTALGGTVAVNICCIYWECSGTFNTEIIKRIVITQYSCTRWGLVIVMGIYIFYGYSWKDVFGTNQASILSERVHQYHGEEKAFTILIQWSKNSPLHLPRKEIGIVEKIYVRHGVIVECCVSVSPRTNICFNIYRFLELRNKFEVRTNGTLIQIALHNI